MLVSVRLDAERFLTLAALEFAAAVHTHKMMLETVKSGQEMTPTVILALGHGTKELALSIQKLLVVFGERARLENLHRFIL